MKNLLYRIYLVSTLTFVFCALAVSAQEENKASLNSQTVQWQRVQSDNGEFMVEMPEGFEFFSEEEGFVMVEAGFPVQGSSATDVEFNEVRILTSYYDKTLMSVESYQVRDPKKGLSLLSKQAQGRKSDVFRGELQGRQIASSGGKYSLILQYFATKTNLYIITAATRGEKTAAMQRFLNSVLFVKPGSGRESIAVKFSALKNSPFELTDETRMAQDNQNPLPISKPAEKDETAQPLVILTQPLPDFTEAARVKGVKGIMRLRVTFSETGRISKIAIISALPGGLTRQVVFAALRIKFLPAEKNGQPVSVTKPVEYEFSTF